MFFFFLEGSPFFFNKSMLRHCFRLPWTVPWTGVQISWVQFRSHMDVSQFGYRSWPAFSRSSSMSRLSSSPRNTSFMPVRPVRVSPGAAVSFRFAIRFRPWFNQRQHRLYRPTVDLSFETNAVFHKSRLLHRYRTALFMVESRVQTLPRAERERDTHFGLSADYRRNARVIGLNVRSRTASSCKTV